MYRPRKHDHVGHMLWDTDFCCCNECGQKWYMTEKGWKAVPDEVTDFTARQPDKSPSNYQYKPESEPERLRRLARNLKKAKPRVRK